MKQTRHLLIALALGTMLTSCGASVSTATVTGPAAYVDPYIGSGGHGHVFVGASVPFGAIQAGPQNIHKGWDWCSGYHHSDSIVIGFAHTHLSGTGCTDMGDVSCIMPVLHPHIAGAAGKSHGDDYHLVDREMACVNSAKGQLLLMALLMENGAARAKQVVERYHAPYESKAAYFSTLDAILRDRELIEYHEDTAQIRL